MSEILVSVCCITFNHKNFIKNCLDGILMQQTNFSFEILINDDCSTDGTSEIIKEYEQNNPLIIKPIYQSINQYSKGIRGMNFRYNFPRARGKYIALCEGDDYWIDSLKLQKQVDFMECNPNYSLCFHNALVVYEHKDCRHIFQVLEDRDYTGNDILKKWTIPTASVVFRKSALPKQYFDNPKILSGDILLFLSMAEIGRIRAINHNMSIYRIHSNGVSFNKKSKDYQKKTIIHNLEISCLFNGKYKIIGRHLAGIAYLRLSLRYLLDLNLIYFIYCVFKSFELNPFAFINILSGKLKRSRNVNRI